METMTDKSEPKVFGDKCDVHCDYKGLFMFCSRYSVNRTIEKNSDKFNRCPQCLSEFPVEVKG